MREGEGESEGKSREGEGDEGKGRGGREMKGREGKGRREGREGEGREGESRTTTEGRVKHLLPISSQCCKKWKHWGAIFGKTKRPKSV